MPQRTNYSVIYVPPARHTELKTAAKLLGIRLTDYVQSRLTFSAPDLTQLHTQLEKVNELKLTHQEHIEQLKATQAAELAQHMTSLVKPR